MIRSQLAAVVCPEIGSIHALGSIKRQRSDPAAFPNNNGGYSILYGNHCVKEKPQNEALKMLFLKGLILISVQDKTVSNLEAPFI